MKVYYREGFSPVWKIIWKSQNYDEFAKSIKEELPEINVEDEELYKKYLNGELSKTLYDNYHVLAIVIWKKRISLQTAKKSIEKKAQRAVEKLVLSLYPKKGNVKKAKKAPSTQGALELSNKKEENMSEVRGNGVMEVSDEVEPNLQPIKSDSPEKKLSSTNNNDKEMVLEEKERLYFSDDEADEKCSEYSDLVMQESWEGFPSFSGDIFF